MTPSILRAMTMIVAIVTTTMSMAHQKSSYPFPLKSFIEENNDPDEDRFFLGTVTVEILDKDTGTAIPGRITVVDENKKWQRLYRPKPKNTAVRKGIFYSDDKGGSFKIPAGTYTIYATRGSEWSMTQQNIKLKANQEISLSFSINREVDTKGFVASDTHLHTFTYSGHGDASVEERLITLAGEGVEFAVATDHNHLTDYRPTQERMNLEPFFTPVVGNEVTTRLGHFNAFPFDPNDERVDPAAKNWPEIDAAIRNKGAEVVIMNHPRWPKKSGRPWGPFEDKQLNRVSGSFAKASSFPFMAIELVNSDTATDDHESRPFFILNDWLALLNHGNDVKAVGSSDSHAVAVVPGQGRTYVKSSTDEPDQISIDEMVQSFKEGRISVSRGIFAQISLLDQYEMGDTVSIGPKQKVTGKLRVQAPSWIKPNQVVIFINGQRHFNEALLPVKGKAFDQTISFAIDRPSVDSHLVAVVIGDGVKEPYWATLEDFTIAATNPIYLDIDGDGAYRSPRQQAMAHLSKFGKSLKDFEKSLDDLDEVVAVQAFDLLFEKAVEAVEKEKLSELLNGLASHKPLLRSYAKERTRLRTLHTLQN